jgi:2-polyprenyl-6-methoxyphenol hydroxylase-like FAD-dependent oxidoreductase
VYPDHGFVVRRRDLDQLVFEHAAAAGAETHQGTEAVAPIVENGLVTGAVVKDKASGETREIRARYVVIADGANSRFGRALGTARNRSLPPGHGHPHLLREPAARRAVDRELPRRARPQRQLAARATAGSSPWATAPSTSASACCPPSGTGATSTPRTS